MGQCRICPAEIWRRDLRQKEMPVWAEERATHTGSICDLKSFLLEACF